MAPPPLPRVLIVDDEALVLRSIARELRGHFEVVGAEDVAGAREALDRHEDLAAVVSDLDLGKSNTGLQVLDLARRSRPDAFRVLISGRAFTDEMAPHLASGLVGSFFQKPWEARALLGTLQEAAALGCSMETAVPLLIDEAESISALLARAQAGDDDALGALFEKHRPLLRKIVLVEQAIPESDAGDVLQLVHLDLARYLPTITQPTGFLAAAARSICRKYVRGKKREAAALRELALLRPRSQALHRFEEKLIGYLDVRGVLRKIGQRCETLIREVLLSRTPYADYARENGIPIGSVGPTVLRCLDKMKAVLTGRGSQKVRHA